MGALPRSGAVGGARGPPRPRRDVSVHGGCPPGLSVPLRRRGPGFRLGLGACDSELESYRPESDGHSVLVTLAICQRPPDSERHWRGKAGPRRLCPPEPGLTRSLSTE